MEPTERGWERDGAGKLTPSLGYTEVFPPGTKNVSKCGSKKSCRTMSCECKKMGSNCTDFCSCGDDCENQPNEAPETIGIANSSNRNDLDHDDLSDSSCAGESDVDIQL